MMNVDEYKLPLKKVIEEFELEKITKQMILIL